MLKDHTAVVGLDNVCYAFREEGSVLRDNTDILNYQHEEADIRLVFHLDQV